MSSADKWYFRHGELSRDGWDVFLDPQTPPVAGWKYTGLRIGTLTESKSLTLPADTNERIIFPLEGQEFLVEYTHDGNTSSQILQGRTSVFHGPADFIYLPINTSATISGVGRIAVGQTPATKVKAVRYGGEVLTRIVNQIANPVRWDLCMQTLKNLGVTGVIELPPAGTLVGLLKRGAPEIETFALKSADDLSAAKEFAGRHA